MKTRALFVTLFAMAAGISAFCLSIAYIVFRYLGDARASRMSFAFLIALVIFSAASLIARGYRKVADAGRARELA